MAFQSPIIFDYLSKPEIASDKPEILSETLGLKSSPLGWMPHIFVIRGDNPAMIKSFAISGFNVGKEEVRLDAVYVVSGMDGKKIDLKLPIMADGVYKMANPDELNSIPAGATVHLSSGDLNGSKGISESEFLASWAIMSLVAEYDGTKYRVLFDQKTIMESISMRFPHVSPRK